MVEMKIVDFTVAFIIFLISASDLYKGILMVFRNQNPLLFMAQISFWILSLLPLSIRERRYQKAMNVYIQRRRLYGAYAILGGFTGLLLSILILLNI